MQNILVTMTRGNHKKDQMDCLELLARPGTTVIFLFPYPVEWLSCLADHWVTTESAKAAMATGSNLLKRYSWEAQTDLARQLVAPVAGTLKKRQVQVEIRLCSGSLGKVVKEYSADQDIDWILMDVPRGGWFSYLMARPLLPAGWSSHLLSQRVGLSFREEDWQQGCRMPTQGLRPGRVYSARRA